LADERLIVDFWDVGQGDCSVITLPDKSLIVIDVGPRTTPLVDWLNERPRQIYALVITHNDDDHAGGLPSLVKLSGVTIENVYMLSDRNRDSEQFKKIFGAVRAEEKKGRFPVIGLDKDRQIWENPDKTLELGAVYPSYSENVEAKTPNESSAILRLRQKNEIGIIWPGDAPMQVVAEKFNGLKPPMLVGPHHGGPVDRKKKDFKTWVTAVQPERLFVSVGTKKNYGLPEPKYLQQRAGHGCHVICSQLTKHCDTQHVNNEIPVLQTAMLLGLRPPRSGVPCRGCFRVTVTAQEVMPDAFDAEHRSRVEKLRRPKCLPPGQ
jgi:beta-lactamase superfamily II metal-dependent hydrolase